MFVETLLEEDAIASYGSLYVHRPRVYRRSEVASLSARHCSFPLTMGSAGVTPSSATQHSVTTQPTIVAEDRPQYGDVESASVEPGASAGGDTATLEPAALERPAVEPAVLELDAHELHRRLVGFQRLADQTRLEFLRLLAIFDHGHRCSELGFSTTRQYLIRVFKFGRSDALEHIRVARKLAELPQLAHAFGNSEIRWSALREVSRVATTETEAEWLDFIHKHTFEQLLHEVKRALREGRDTPTSTSDYGLSNITARVSFEMSLEEKERLKTALAIVAESMGEGAPRDTASVLTFVSQQILEGAWPTCAGHGAQIDDESVRSVDGHTVDSDVVNGCAGGDSVLGNAASVHTADGVDPTRSRISLLYMQCPDCAKSRVATPDGPIDVEPKVVDRQAAVAQVTTITPEECEDAEPLPKGEIDVPNSRALARKVRCRDGNCCQNPGCGSRIGIQAHHIQWRCEQGRTILANELAVCRRCHTLIHSGLLEVERTVDGVIEWKSRLSDEAGAPAFDPIPDLAAYQIPSSCFVRRSEVQPSTTVDASRPRPSTVVDGRAGADEGVDLNALARGLTRLGYTRQEALERLQLAEQKLREAGKPIEEQPLCQYALTGRIL